MRELVDVLRVLRATLPVLALLAFAPVPAQQPLPGSPGLVENPDKGPPDLSPLTEAERTMLRTQRPPHTPLPPATAERTTAATATGRVLTTALLDECGDGRIWAIGNTWKASLGSDGFAYVPYFGSQAPRDFPLHLRLQSVCVGGARLPLAAGTPQHAAQQFWLDHGRVTERYDLRPDAVEQTFVVDSDAPGAVDIALAVTSELVEHGTQPGLQFGNEHGRVDYGQAFVVRDRERLPVPTTYADGVLTIHVPASARGTGPLVVDPILSTHPVVIPFPNAQSSPDIAYDETTDVYLLVWQYAFSASDYDVHCEFASVQGTPFLGTFGTVDATTISHENPRVANNNAADRFLIVMQRFENARWQVWGRLRLANQGVHPILFPISDPTVPGNALSPDVGGDPAPSGVADNFLVVWQRDLSANDSDIHGRLVRVDTALVGGTIAIEDSIVGVFALPNVSNSNGNGFATVARWMVVYQYRHSATDWDIYASSLEQNGAIAGPSQVVESSAANDLVPSVSSPNTDLANGIPFFLITWERQNPPEARARLVNSNLTTVFSSPNLTAAFGLGPFWVRAECDGNRFAVLHGSTTIQVATIVYTGSVWLQQEPSVPLPGTPEFPRLCSKRSAGGQRTDYGIVYTDVALNPDRTALCIYEGRAPTSGVVVHSLACNGLGIDHNEANNIGETIVFQLTNLGTDIPTIAFGTPTPPSNLICGSCPLGVSTNGMVLTVGSTLAIAIPPSWWLVGHTFAVQGVAFGSGPCVLQFRTSDACEFTLR